MQENHSLIFEKMFGKCVAHEKVKIEGIAKSVKIDIYDGFAIGQSGEDKITMEYPLLSVVKSSPELVDELKDYLDDIEDINEITPIQVMQTFATIFRNGVELKVKTKESK